MSEAVIVRYRVKPEALEQNIDFVRAVYDEIAGKRPEGLRYSTYQVDERTFVHVAILDGSANPLDDIAAFGAFTEGIAERCEEGPQVTRGDVVGCYPEA
jgi:hypothetical protein